MVNTLTKASKVSAEQLRISQLTNDHTAHFKVILSHQIEKGFDFSSLHRRKGQPLSHSDTVKIMRAWGKFIDDSIKLPMSDVEAKYKRNPDVSDGTYDPKTKSTVQIEHFCLFLSTDKADKLTDQVRLHGYFRNNGGYFVITRLDWFHSYHK